MTLRYSRMAATASVALFFTLVAFGNITDYGTNFAFVSHVLAMDTTFRSPNLMWRAITDPVLHHAAYIFIITWETATSLVLWWGLWRLAMARHAPAAGWHAARGVAIAGLTMGLLLYGAGFIAVGGEWFAMWQSRQWNGQDSAARFLVLIGVALLHLGGTEADQGTGNRG